MFILVRLPKGICEQKGKQKGLGVREQTSHCLLRSFCLGIKMDTLQGSGRNMTSDRVCPLSSPCCQITFSPAPGLNLNSQFCMEGSGLGVD